MKEKQFNFKETIEKCLAGKLSGNFVNRAGGYFFKSSEFTKISDGFYKYTHILTGKKSRVIEKTFCAAGNCVEDIGTDYYYFQITDFIEDKK